MRFVGNVLWHFPFFGFLNAIFVYALGLILTLTVIAAPIGLGLMEFGKFLFAPFSRAMISKSELNSKQNPAWKAYSTLIMIVYIPFGLISCFFAVIQVAFLFFTIVGIPVALVVAKSLGTYFNPVNKVCVPQAVADELDRRQAQVVVTKYMGG